MRNETRGYALTFLAAMAFGSTAIFARLAYRFESEPMALALLRGLITVAALLPPLLLAGPGRLRLRMTDVPLFAGLALTGFSLNSLAFLHSLRHTTVATATILLNLYPALVVVGATLLFGERPHGKWPAVALTLVGSAFVVQLFHPANFRANLPGLAWGLLGAGAAAGNVLMAKRALVKYTAAGLVGHSAWIGCLWLLIFRGPHPPQWPRYEAAAWLPFLGLGLAGVVGHLAKNQALRHLESGRVSVLGTAEVLVAVGLAALLFGERLTAGQAFGTLLVLLGIGLLRRR